MEVATLVIASFAVVLGMLAFPPVFDRTVAKLLERWFL
jgi:hypothetical protein